MQRALMQYFRPENHALVLEALRRAGREDLIGFGRECLVPPRLIRREGKGEKGARSAPGKPKGAPRKGGRAESAPGRSGKPKDAPRKGGRPGHPAAPNPKKKRPARPSPPASGAGRRGPVAAHGQKIDPLSVGRFLPSLAGQIRLYRIFI